MKKTLSILLIIMIVFICVACSEPSNNQIDNIASEETVSYTLNDEEEALVKLLILCSETFKDPLSIKIKNAWTYKGSVCYYYTFELEAKNGYGILTTGYYGGMIIGDGITEEVLNDIEKEISYGGSTLKFDEDDLTALQRGTQLNSQCISAMQDYFIKNYHD